MNFGEVNAQKLPIATFTLKMKPMKLTKNKYYWPCNKLWEFLIKSRAGFCCEMCGSGTNGLHAAHIIGRRAYWTRWRLRNGLALCPGCHDDVKIKAWLIAESRRQGSNYRWRWRWIVKEKMIVHQGLPDPKNEYSRLRTKEVA